MVHFHLSLLLIFARCLLFLVTTVAIETSPTEDVRQRGPLENSAGPSPKSRRGSDGLQDSEIQRVG